MTKFHRGQHFMGINSLEIQVMLLAPSSVSPLLLPICAFSSTLTYALFTFCSLQNPPIQFLFSSVGILRVPFRGRRLEGENSRNERASLRLPVVSRTLLNASPPLYAGCRDDAAFASQQLALRKCPESLADARDVLARPNNRERRLHSHWHTKFVDCPPHQQPALPILTDLRLKKDN